MNLTLVSKEFETNVAVVPAAIQLFLVCPSVTIGSRQRSFWMLGNAYRKALYEERWTWIVLIIRMEAMVITASWMLVMPSIIGLNTGAEFANEMHHTSMGFNPSGPMRSPD